MTKATGGEFNIVFVHPKPEALDMLPIIVFACTNSLKGLRSVRARSSILLIARICNLQVQMSIYLSAGEEEEVWGYPLEEEKVFAADLDKIIRD